MGFPGFAVDLGASQRTAQTKRQINWRITMQTGGRQPCAAVVARPDGSRS